MLGIFWFWLDVVLMWYCGYSMLAGSEEQRPSGCPATILFPMLSDRLRTPSPLAVLAISQRGIFHDLGFRTAGTGARTDPPPGPRPCRAELTSLRTPFLDRSKGLLPLSMVSCNASSCWASSRAWKLARGNRQEFLTIVLLRGPSSTRWRVAESSVSHAVRSTNRGVRSRIVIR